MTTMHVCMRLILWCGAAASLLLMPDRARSQIVITEVMYEPGGVDSLWEWVEIVNTTAAPVNLNGWVFDDDDDGTIGGVMGGANIVASPSNNTIVPAGGVAVLYPGD